ncbi:MAG: type II secretion system protein [Candidatus Tectomicrobia bacterium]|uniref:Type II secretion system protein n=1 Tax=Tectimicrobiota bacterium TaxID=2528274 RepID=A0A932CLH7_UNCTE|nr:type II secretion system protein [Candidatus Tectomicrobia bacterium]
MIERGEEKEKWVEGFTLIELMIVVAIIGLLVSLAVPNFVKFHYKAKQAEIKRNLGIIRQLEEAYATEHEVYLAVAAYHPGGASSGRQSWNSATTDFSILGFEPKGGVYFDYKVDNVSGNESFVAYGRGDLDGDSSYNIWTMNQAGILTNTNPSQF